MPKDPKSKKVSKAKAAKNTVDVEIAAEVVDDSKPKLKKVKNRKKHIINYEIKKLPNGGSFFDYLLRSIQS